METVPQPDYCPVEPEQFDNDKAKPASVSKEDNINQPIGVVPPDMPNQAEVTSKADKSAKTSPWLFILVMFLLTISSGLGYLIVMGQTDVLIQLLPIN